MTTTRVRALRAEIRSIEDLIDNLYELERELEEELEWRLYEQETRPRPSQAAIALVGRLSEWAVTPVRLRAVLLGEFRRGCGLPQLNSFPRERGGGEGSRCRRA
jgi:hypothetical protein